MMFTFKVPKIFATSLTIMLLLIVIWAPVPSQTCQSKHVTYYSRPYVYTGQLFATLRRSEPCPRCQMRDHRGRCRRILSFNSAEGC